MNNSIARVCHEAQDLALGEKFSSAPPRAENMDAVRQCCSSPCGGNVSKTHGLGKKFACSKLVRRETQLRDTGPQRPCMLRCLEQS